MTTLTFVDKTRDAAFLLSQANGTRSVDEVTIVSGQNLVAGTVLGKITASGKYTAFDQDAVDGSEAAAGVLLLATDATDGDTNAACVVRDAEVAANRLTWPSDILEAETDAAVAELAALGVIVRS